MRTVIEGKRDLGSQLQGADRTEISPEPDEAQLRRHDVYVLKGGRLNIQTAGVKQFERSLEKRVRKMMSF
jgi:hypothetical protein